MCQQAFFLTWRENAHYETWKQKIWTQKLRKISEKILDWILIISVNWQFLKSASAHHSREARNFLAFWTVKIHFFPIIRPPPFFHVLVSKRETILKNVKLNLPPFTFRERARVKKKKPAYDNAPLDITPQDRAPYLQAHKETRAWKRASLKTRVYTIHATRVYTVHATRVYTGHATRTCTRIHAFQGTRRSLNACMSNQRRAARWLVPAGQWGQYILLSIPGYKPMGKEIVIYCLPCQCV